MCISDLSSIYQQFSLEKTGGIQLALLIYVVVFNRNSLISGHMTKHLK